MGVARRHLPPPLPFFSKTIDRCLIFSFTRSVKKTRHSRYSQNICSSHTFEITSENCGLLAFQNAPGELSKTTVWKWELFLCHSVVTTFVSCNGRPRNMIAALGYLTWWYKICSHLHTISHRELTRRVFESYQSSVFGCYLKSVATTTITIIFRVSRFFGLI